MVLVKWVDAATPEHMEWEPRDAEAMDPEVVYTVGFVHFEDKDRIELLMAHGSGQICGRFQIPKPCILCMSDLSTSGQSQDGVQG